MGAALWLRALTPSIHQRIRQTVFFQNKAQRGGGALFYDTIDMKEAPESSLLIRNCTFVENEAIVQGGAIYWNLVAPRIIDRSSFTKNIAGVYGNDIASYPVGLIDMNTSIKIGASLKLSLHSNITLAIKNWCPLNNNEWGELYIHIFCS
jgi:hypothetical protein